MSDPPKTEKPKRTRPKRLRRLLLAALVLIGAWRCVQWARDAYTNHHGAAEQARVLARIEKEGIPIGYKALRRATPPDDGVSMEDAQRAAELIGAARYLYALDRDSLDELPAVGHYVLGELGQRIDPEVVAGMRQAVHKFQTMDALLEQALLIGAMTADFDPTKVRGWAPEDHKNFLRSAVNWLSMKATLAMAEGDGDRALQWSMRQFNAGDLLGRYHDSVAPMLRFAVYSQAAHGVQRTLAYTRPSVDELRRTRRTLVDRLDKISLDRVLICELAINAWHLKHAEHCLITSLQGHSELLAKDEFKSYSYARSRVIGPYGDPVKRPESMWERYEWTRGLLDKLGVDLDELEESEEKPAYVASYRQRLNELVDRPGVAKAALAELVENGLDCYLDIKAGNEKTLILRSDLDEGEVYPEGMTRAYRAMQASISLAIALIDLELHHRAHGEWPEKIDKFKDWPTDPFGGDPLRYRRTDGGCTVWTIGQNHVDDHGERHGKKDDTAFRLLNPQTRGKVEPPPEPEGLDDFDVGFGP